MRSARRRVSICSW